MGAGFFSSGDTGSGFGDPSRGNWEGFFHQKSMHKLDLPDESVLKLLVSLGGTKGRNMQVYYGILVGAFWTPQLKNSSQL